MAQGSEKRKNTIGNRMKVNYEFPARHYLTRHVPVIIRVDGRAFHGIDLTKPFDSCFGTTMKQVALKVLFEMQGGVLAYTQSDEISFLLWDWSKNSSSAWFDYRKSKLESITASLATRYFAEVFSDGNYVFDARAFNIPISEVPNYFIWRMRDWEQNSLNMFAQSFYSQKQLNGKNKEQMHEMLHKKEVNWASLSDDLKNGTLVFPNGTISYKKMNYEKLAELIFPLLTTEEAEVKKHDN